MICHVVVIIVEATDRHTAVDCTHIFRSSSQSLGLLPRWVILLLREQPETFDGTQRDFSTMSLYGSRRRLYRGRHQIVMLSTLGWLKKRNMWCNTDGTTAKENNDRYVDWWANKFTQDCPESSGGICGGLAEDWDLVYSSSLACCGRIGYLGSMSNCS